MFGNKNAGPHETWMRLGLHRRNAEQKKTQSRTVTVIPISSKGFEMYDLRETYFAVGSLIRRTL